MLLLSGLVAVFPTVKAKYTNPLKVVLYPIATAIVFAAAWGVNSGLSVGEEAINNSPQTSWSFPSLIPSAYAQDLPVTNRVTAVTNRVTETNHPAFQAGTKVNEVDFESIDHSTKVKVPPSFKLLAPKNVWGFTTTNGLMYLKGKDGEWYGYRPKKDEPKAAPQQQQHRLQGGFFKRWK